MSIFRVTKHDVDTLTVVTNPTRAFTSSSRNGVTGSVYVYPRRSHIEKEVEPVSSFVDSVKNDSDINVSLSAVQALGLSARNGSTNAQATFSGSLAQYMTKVNAQQSSVRKKKVLNVSRFIPSYQFTKDTLKKLYVKDVLNERYRSLYPSAHWAYTNYNTVNFFTASTVPTSSALLYPNIDVGPQHVGYASGTYSLSGAFSFDFYVNPRYTTDTRDGTFKTGTILHLSSSYALSLMSGSSRDEQGRPNKFRLLLQLSHSADVPPSLMVTGTYPNDLAFMSDDNALALNNWHHVVIRWGTNEVNHGTGSFNVDGTDKGTFVIPSGTVAPRIFDDGSGGPAVLTVGNYYEGNNTGLNAQALFFATNPSIRDGLELLINDGGGGLGANEPANYFFRHPLNAELHDLSIKRYYMSDRDISVSASRGPAQLDSDKFAFYLPPFFVQNSPLRQFVQDYGGIWQTPFFEVNGTTDDPFNVAMSFGVAGHHINIENFLRDFASDVFPRCHHLTGAVYASTTGIKSANEFLYDQPQVVKRNLTILPCDDGNFVPNYSLLVSESAARVGTSTTHDKYVDDLGLYDASLINLDNLVSTASLLFGSALIGVSGSSAASDYIERLIGFSPEDPTKPAGGAFSRYSREVEDLVSSGTYDPGVQVGAPLTIYQRTRDASSNQVCFFNISNLYYGQSIKPQSFVVTDESLSGSSGAIKITLRDDGYGNIYRADALTPHATWASVGNLYYNEGIAVVKSPHLFFFGQEGFDMEMRGVNSVHVMNFNLLAPSGYLNKSTNPAFMPVSASFSLTDNEKDFVYISNIDLRDENMNVVAKAQLAQPIMKRPSNNIMFKVKFDW